MNPLMKQLIIASICGALDVLKAILDEESWKPLADNILNLIEGAFKEDTTLDSIAEEITGRIRRRFEIIDSNPDN